MTEPSQRHSLAPGQGVLDAAPGPTVSHSAPLFSGYYDGSPTISDAGALPTPSQPSQQGPQGSSQHTLPLTGNNSSYSFSFCGSDAFGVNDILDTESTPPPQPQSSQPPVQQQSFVPALSTNTGAAPAVALNPVALSAATLEYFYGIPTPSAPPRTPYATSNASNCSSNHQQQTASPQPPQPPQPYSSHHGSVSGESNHTASSFSHPAMEANTVYPQQGTNGMAVPPQLVPPVMASVSSNSGIASSGSGMQKDVLAFMAAEQQQQKFVLQQRNVYMSGLPVDFRPSAFRAMCEVFGRIESSKLCMESDDANRCRGFGFVLFYDVDSANSCIASLNGKVMQGKTLQVRRADLSAAPQPLNPVTQRNRTGSGLVTPPTLAPMNPNGSGSGVSNPSGMPSMPGNGTPGSAAAAYTMFNPHPPGLTSGNAHPNAVPSSVVMSTLPFTFATPTLMGPAAVSTANSTNGTLVGQKGSATGSSFLYGGPSASSSLGNSNTPNMVYPQNATMVPAMRNGVPIMQVFAPCPPPGSANMIGSQQQQQQQATLVSHPSVSRSDAATTPHSATTPSSAGSSNRNLGFATSPQMTTQQQQQQQMQMPFQPQPPMHPPMQPQRPMAQNSHVTFYSAVDGAGAPFAPTTLPSGSCNVTSGGGAMPGSNAFPNAQGNMYATNVLMQEYLTANGLDANASNPNIYYLFPQ